MSETSLPLPLDAPGPAPTGSPTAPKAGEEVTSDQLVSDFCLMLAAELARGETVTGETSVPEVAGPSPVDPAADGKDLPPPSGMPLPLPMGQTDPSAPLPQGMASVEGTESAMARPAVPPAVMAATVRPTASEPAESVELREDGERPPELQPSGTAALPKHPKLDTEKGAIVTRATDAPEILSARGPEPPHAFQVDLRTTGAPADQALKGPVADPPSLPLAEPLHTPRWGEGFANRVSWMVKQDLQQAELRLNPPDLGPLEVRIAVANDEARITFTAQHALVRDAVEAALPRLREMLTANGLNLAQVDVGQQSSHGGQGGGPGTEPAATGLALVGGGQPDDGLQNHRPVVSSLHEGLVDDYA
jgi:hypothetical protein